MACGNCCLHPSLTEPLTDLHWSRLESLLRKSQAPSDIQKQTLTKVEHDIEEYDLAIAQLQSAIVSLEFQRDVAKDYVSRHKSLVAPIRRLSNDVLAEIFTYICSDTTLCTSGARLPQLHLCQVCKYWRSLVDDNPLLWSTLAMMLYPQDEHSIPDTTLLNLANLVLTKSRNCPLTITLYDSNEVHPVSALLFQHADRWLSAIVGCNQRFLSVSSFPQLKHLNLNNGSSEIQTIPVMPSLESLEFELLPVTSHSPLPDFPWNQLRRLRLVTPFLSHYVFVISRCIQLQYLTLGFDLEPFERGQEDSLPPVSIASQTIVSLTLNHMVEEDCKKLFSLLQFPQLHVLELECCDLPADFTYPFIAHSLSITSLSLKDLEFSLEDLFALLRLLPTVTHFSFYQHWWKGTLEDFFSKLRPAYPSELRTLLPRLTHIEMRVAYEKGEHNLDPATSAFVELVKSRVAGNGLKSVRLSLSSHCLNHDLISSLAYLPKVGIAISIQDKCGLIL